MLPVPPRQLAQLAPPRPAYFLPSFSSSSFVAELCVLGKIDEILAWERRKETERDTMAQNGLSHELMFKPLTAENGS